MVALIFSVMIFKLGEINFVPLSFYDALREMFDIYLIDIFFNVKKKKETTY